MAYGHDCGLLLARDADPSPKRLHELRKAPLTMSAEDLERYETEIELSIFKEYHDIVPMFRYVVETERRFYLCNELHQEMKEVGGHPMLELLLRDAWVWDMYRPARFVATVRVITFRDVNIEELPKDA